MNGRAPASGTAVHATTGFGSAANPATFTGAGVDANGVAPRGGCLVWAAVRPGSGTARQTDFS